MREPNPQCPKCHGLNVDVFTRSHAACPACWPEKPEENAGLHEKFSVHTVTEPAREISGVNLEPKPRRRKSEDTTEE